MRSDEWTAEFGHLLPPEGDIRKLVLDGSIEICPACGELSAYAYQDVTADDDLDGDPPAFWKPPQGTIAHIGAAGWSEWECGHCGRHWMDADSPLNHPAYTHEEPNDFYEDPDDF